MTFKAIVFMVSIVLFVTFPYILIWAVNTLFNTNIPYNLLTYLAALILCKPFVALTISLRGN